MKTQLKTLALCAGLFLAVPSASALPTETIDVTFSYDRSAPTEVSYRRAERTAVKACGLNGRVAPMKRALTKSCVQPLVEAFVIATGDTALRAYYEDRNGRLEPGTRFVEK